MLNIALSQIGRMHRGLNCHKLTSVLTFVTDGPGARMERVRVQVFRATAYCLQHFQRSSTITRSNGHRNGQVPRSSEQQGLAPHGMKYNLTPTSSLQRSNLFFSSPLDANQLHP